jgi:enterochelin esterase-like enzyme
MAGAGDVGGNGGATPLNEGGSSPAATGGTTPQQNTGGSTAIGGAGGTGGTGGSASSNGGAAMAGMGGKAQTGGTGGAPVPAKMRPASGFQDLVNAPLVADPTLKPHPGVPVGKLLKNLTFQSKIYGKPYKYDLYVPAQYKAGQPAAMGVYFDGSLYVGCCLVNVVMDNLIATGEMPTTIAAFVTPLDRGREYVTSTDEFAKFLKDELFVEIAKSYDITSDPKMRMAVGISSGGLVAFALLWDHPELFKKAIGDSPSFASFASKDYPALVKSTRPIRDFRFAMTVGDMDNIDQYGNWLDIFKRMEAALKSSGYDYRALLLKGDHSTAKVILQMSDNLRWLWWDWKKP